MEIEKSIRYRINISRGMKGSFSYEATVDGENYTREEVLIFSDQLVAALESRYPIVEVK